MKISLYQILFVFIVTAVCFAGDGTYIKIGNPYDYDRPSEIVEIYWHSLPPKIQQIAPEEFHVFDVDTKEDVIWQKIDLNQDGDIDKLLLCVDLKAGKTRQLCIEKKSIKAFEPRTLVRFMPPREDLAWENDKIAFRIYGPALSKEVSNGIDVWTKRVSYPIIEKWYKGDETPGNARVSYHEDHGEGADFFSVGKTLGAGGNALFFNDSLYQPGVFESYNIIASGPIRTIFEVRYKPVYYKGMKVSETEIITLDCGSNLNKIDVYFTADSLKERISYAAGLVKREGVSSYVNKEFNYISMWGPVNDKPENGSLGTAVFRGRQLITDYFEKDNCQLMIVPVSSAVKRFPKHRSELLDRPGLKSTYYAGACWTNNGDIKNGKEWNSYIETYSRRLVDRIKYEL